MGFAAAGLLLTAASTGIQMYSQLQAGKTAKTVAKYNNQLAQNEAENKELEFAESAKRASINQQRSVATIRAQLAQQGTVMTTGTPLAVVGENSSIFQTRLADAARASAMEAESLRAKGRMGIWEGNQAAKAAKLAAIGTGIQGLTSAVSAYGHNRYTGAF